MTALNVESGVYTKTTEFVNVLAQYSNNSKLTWCHGCISYRYEPRLTNINVHENKNHTSEVKV